MRRWLIVCAYHLLNRAQSLIVRGRRRLRRACLHEGGTESTYTSDYSEFVHCLDCGEQVVHKPSVILFGGVDESGSGA